MAELSLPQQYMLLALDPDAHKFGLPAKPVMQTFACGAAIAELLHARKLRLREDGRLEVTDGEPVGYAGADLLLSQLLSAGGATTIRKWMHELYSRRSPRAPLFEAEMEALLGNGMMSREPRKLLFVFPSVRYTPHPAAVSLVVRRIYEGLLEQAEADDRAVLLAMLLDASKLLKAYFAADELERLRGKLKAMQETDGGRFTVFRQIRRTIDEIHVVLVTVSAM